MDFNIDSTASHHAIFNPKLIHNFKPYFEQKPVKLTVNAETIYSRFRGSGFIYSYCKVSLAVPWYKHQLNWLST